MKTPPWDDGHTLPALVAEYRRLDRNARAHCDAIASRSAVFARAYLLGRMEMREELAQARKTARKTVLAAVDSGERREREGGGACP